MEKDINPYELKRYRRYEKASTIGIYFLFNNSKLVYIGRSQHIFNRIQSHIGEGKKIFTEFAYIVTTREASISLENILIKKYRPKYNKFLSYSGKMYRSKVRQFKKHGNTP